MPGLVPVAGTGSGFEKGSAAGGSGAGLLDVAIGGLAAGGILGGTGAGLLDVAAGGSLVGGPTGTRRFTDFCGVSADALGLTMMIGRGEAALAGAAMVAATPTTASAPRTRL
jgi:hypothetical protein